MQRGTQSGALSGRPYLVQIDLLAGIPVSRGGPVASIKESRSTALLPEFLDVFDQGLALLDQLGVSHVTVRRVLNGSR